MTVFYKGEITGTRRVDFLVEDLVSVEFKATTKFDDANLNQGINYLEAMRLEIGLLFNFGTKKLTIKRLINSKHLNPDS
jgi:GxxExxY protein